MNVVKKQTHKTKNNNQKTKQEKNTLKTIAELQTKAGFLPDR